MVRSALIVLIVAVAVLYTCEARKPCSGGPHDTWNTCGSPCPPACDTNPDIMCPTVCVPRCQCEEEYVRNYDGKCIKPEECKKST